VQRADEERAARARRRFHRREIRRLRRWARANDIRERKAQS
jgi:hypothetical protein